MGKKVWVGFIVVFVVLQILDYIVNSLILMSTYQSLQSVWRPDMKLWLFPVIGLVVAYLFAFIFSKGYEGKGIAEGVRYGIYMGLFMNVPAAYAQYAIYPIPYSLALQWFIFGMVEFIVAGMVLAWVFGMKPKEAAAS